MNRGGERRASKVLVVAAHPDDEVLGCGGTICRHMLNGDSVRIVVLADGETSRDGNADGKTIAKREAAARAAAATLGTKQIVFHRFPDQRLSSVPFLDLVKAVEKHVNEMAPEIVYTHHSGDLNADHRLAHEAAVTACRPTPEQSVRTILLFEVASSTEWQPPSSGAAFQPNWFVDIDEVLDQKLKALSAYADEMRDWPHPRSLRGVEHLARWRGASVGRQAAEAFVVARHTL